MVLTGDFEMLRRGAVYRSALKPLRMAGIGSIVFGVLGVVLGVSSMKDSPINAGLALLGAFLFVEGLWLVIAPTVTGILVDGVALVALGVWNLYVTVLNMTSGARTGGHFVAIAVFQVVWGIQAFARYGRFRNQSLERPMDIVTSQLDEIDKAVRKAKAAETPDLVTIQARTALRAQVWKGRLGPDHAIFVENSGEMLLVRPHEVRFETTGKVLIGKALKGTFTIGDQALQGTIDPQSLERYEAWVAERQGGIGAGGQASTFASQLPAG